MAVAVAGLVCVIVVDGALGVVVHTGSATGGRDRSVALKQVREHLLPLLDELRDLGTCEVTAVTDAATTTNHAAAVPSASKRPGSYGRTPVPVRTITCGRTIASCALRKRSHASTSSGSGSRLFGGRHLIVLQM